MSAEPTSLRDGLTPDDRVMIAEANLELLRERIIELEQGWNEPGWQEMSLGGSTALEFSRDQLRKIARMARVLVLKNPTIKRAVRVQADYVWALGVTIRAEDQTDQSFLTDFLDDPANQVELTSHLARHQKEIALQVDGNLFFVLFSDVAGRVRVRTLPFDQIDDIICNPEDAKEHWFYKRVWVERSVNLATGQVVEKDQIAYYPDWRYEPPGGLPSTIGGKPVRGERVYHVAVGNLPEMRFGVPETYAAHDWALAYKSFLEDWATITRAYARFAWRLTVAGGQRGLNAATARLGTTIGQGESTTERNPPALAGSIFAAADGRNLDPIRTAGATTKAEDGRRILLMVAAAMDLPETMFGDVSVGTLATARSMDRPTELKFRSRQTLWQSVLSNICLYAIQKRRGRRSTKPPVVQVVFPDILERDIAERVLAVVRGATLDGKPLAGLIDPVTTLRLILGALGVDDVEALVEFAFPGGKAPDAFPTAATGGAAQPTAGSPTHAGAELGRVPPD